MATEKKTTEVVSKEQDALSMDASYLDDFAGDGLDGMTGSALSTPYLSIVQPESEFEGDAQPAGTWRNSATGDNYGNIVRVIPLAFTTYWCERETTGDFRTVNRYPVNGIEVEVRKPAPGQKGYPKMINPATGNEITEMFAYIILLADHPEQGPVLLTPTPLSMKTARQWNTLLRHQLLPNGKPAPIFAYSWNLVTDLVDNPKTPKKKIGKLTQAIKDTITNKDMFTTYIKDNLTLAKQEIMQLSANNAGDDGVVADAQ